MEELKRAVFWGKIRFGMPRKFSSYASAMSNQELSLDELDELNFAKRKAIFAYAYNHVPFYRQKYSQAGLFPEDIKVPDDFTLIPILTKDEIRENASELISTEATSRIMTESSTGGSTGAPIKVMHDNRFHYEPLLWRMLGWWGVSPDMDSAYALRLQRKKIIKKCANTLMWYPTRRAHLDASFMSERDILEFVHRLIRIKPKLVQGYVGSIYHLALFMEDHGLKIEPPKAVWVTSSPISKLQRQKIENVFGAPVYDQYGCGEVFAIAAQCSAREGLHVFHDYRYLEFVDNNTKPVAIGKSGEILITDLENKVFPIIRYQNGDVGKFRQQQCTCGLNLPLIDAIKGRVSDTLFFPDGSVISGDYLTTIFDDFPDSIQAFQIRQEKDYSVRLLYVPSSTGYSARDAVARVRVELEKRIGLKARLFVEKVDDLPHDAGKLRFVISAVEI